MIDTKQTEAAQDSLSLGERAWIENDWTASRESARRVLAVLQTFVRPDSVLDVGCGTGTWLRAFMDCGVQDVVGVDGPYVDRHSLLIPPERFIGHDLNQPLSLDRRFDMVVSVEVGEHLSPASAPGYIRMLASFGDVVLFSAAIPEQGGVGHINEQWPEYWRKLFDAEGFLAIDCIRPRIWNDAAIERWYRQNLLVYVRKERLCEHSLLFEESTQAPQRILNVVHPESLLAAHAVPGVRGAARMLFKAGLAAMKKRFRPRVTMA